MTVEKVNCKNYLAHFFLAHPVNRQRPLADPGFPEGWGQWRAWVKPITEDWVERGPEAQLPMEGYFVHYHRKWGQKLRI